jgi:membrane protein implicated in regulation of membrane protease activity
MARKYTTRHRIGPDFGSVLVMAAVVGAAWLLFGWSPVGFGLTLACVVIVLTAVEAAVFPRRRTTHRMTRREARRADRRGTRR